MLSPQQDKEEGLMEDNATRNLKCLFIMLNFYTSSSLPYQGTIVSELISYFSASKENKLKHPLFDEFSNKLGDVLLELQSINLQD